MFLGGKYAGWGGRFNEENQGGGKLIEERKTKERVGKKKDRVHRGETRRSSARTHGALRCQGVCWDTWWEGAKLFTSFFSVTKFRKRQKPAGCQKKSASGPVRWTGQGPSAGI